MTRSRGYTLVELVVVLILTSVLAIALMPRLFATGDFAARGARDDLLSALRYARQSAIAMRRNVCVAASTTLLTVTYASTAGATQTCAAANTVAKPGNGLAFGDSANAMPSGVTLASAATLVFDAQGRPSTSVGNPLTATMTFTVNGAAAVVSVEPETGFVH